MLKCIKRKYNVWCNIRCTFNESWNKIRDSTRTESYSNLYYCVKKYNRKDEYFENVPMIQDFLTDIYMISTSEIEYSNYFQIEASMINDKNFFDCFHGILFYIYYYSNNKFNIIELEFHYSGAKNRESLTSLINKSINNNEFYDIINIFNYENINKQFVIESFRNAFFGVSFKRIKIKPIAYSIRSGTSIKFNGNLISFTFEGYDEERQEWEVLDERENIIDLNSEGGYKLFFVHTTNKYFSSFKIKQTQPGSNDFWGFSISGFDIHGIISIRENQFYQNENIYDEESFSFKYDNKKICENENEYESYYDPIIDMNNFL